MKTYTNLMFAATAISELYHISKCSSSVAEKWIKDNNYSKEELIQFVNNDKNYKRLAHEEGHFGPGPGEKTANMLQKKHLKAVNQYFMT